MSRAFKILFALSILVNGIFIVYQLRLPPPLPRYEIAPAFKIKNLKVQKEKEKFIQKLYSVDPKMIDKKYFFLTIWHASENWVGDLLLTDTLVKPIRKDIGYIFVNGESDAYVNHILRKKKIKITNFAFTNKNDTLIHALYQESKIKGKSKFLFLVPMAIILDKKGNTIYFDTLGFVSRFKDSLASSNRYFGNINKKLSELK